ISFRYPGFSSEPIDIQLKIALATGPISSLFLDDDVKESMGSLGMMVGKTTLDIGWDFGESAGHGMDFNVVGQAGMAGLGGTIAIQDLNENGAPPIPSSFALNVGPQFGAQVNTEVEFTGSARDLYNNMSGSAGAGSNRSNYEDRMSGAKVK